MKTIDELNARSTQPVVSPLPSRNSDAHPFETKATDTPAQAKRRDFMASDFAKALYVQRGATVECTNAHLRCRGLSRFNVCGLVKANMELQWYVLAHNLMRMRSLQMAFAA